MQKTKGREKRRARRERSAEPVSDPNPNPGGRIRTEPETGLEKPNRARTRLGETEPNPNH